MSRSTVSAEDLLSAANDASGQARNMWLSFLALLTYLVVALASITDKALLLNEQIKLPVINVEISINAFFVFGPVLLLVLQFGILVQHVMLARKLHEFNTALNDPNFRCPTRAKVHSYVFSQLAAGLGRSKVLDGALRLMIHVTLKASSLVVLIYFLISLLPLHNIGLANWLRGVFVADLALVLLVGGFLTRPAEKFIPIWKQRWRKEPFGSLTEVVCSFCGLFLVFLVATVPGEWADREIEKWWPVERNGRRIFVLTDYLLEGKVNLETGERASPFSRNLDLRNFDFRTLVTGPAEEGPGKEQKKAESANQILRLPRLDLRYALLTGAVFRDLDLKHVRLDRATLLEADLRNARLIKKQLQGINIRRADLQGAVLTNAILKEAELQGAELQGANLSEAELQGANLSEANLQGANLSRAKLQGSNFGEANLQGANLSRAELQDANLKGAQLQGANLRAAQMQSVNLKGANLQLANLARANLKGANLAGANLQGAELSWAGLQVVNLQDAKLQVADLQGAQLQGANLQGASLQAAILRNAGLQAASINLAEMKGADLRGAKIWQTAAPKSSSLELADLTSIGLKALPDKPDPNAGLFGLKFVKFIFRRSKRDLEIISKEQLEKLIEETNNLDLYTRLLHRVGPLLNHTKDKAWFDSKDHKAWTGFLNRPKLDPAMLSEFLTKLACQGEIEEQVAKVIVRRSLRPHISGIFWRLNTIPNYNFDRKKLAQGLTSRDCKIASNLDQQTKAELCKLAEWPENKIKETYCS